MELSNQWTVKSIHSTQKGPQLISLIILFSLAGDFLGRSKAWLDSYRISFETGSPSSKACPQVQQILSTKVCLKIHVKYKIGTNNSLPSKVYLSGVH